jgi:GntR family transcriptional regulator
MRKMQGSMKLQSNGTLLHRQLYVLLREQIVTGRYHAGDRLPTQDELCRQFSISRITVRRALTDLQDEGLIRNEQGVGAFVTAGIERLKRGPDFSFIGDMRRVLAETTMQLLLLEMQRCPPDVAQALGLPPASEALHVVRTRSKDGQPVALIDGWIPPPFADNVTAAGLQEKSLHELIAGGFDKLGRVAQEVNAALADPIVAQGLKVDLNSAVLRMTRLVHHREGPPVHYVTVWTTPLRTRLVMAIEAEEIGGHNVGRLLHDVRK